MNRTGLFILAIVFLFSCIGVPQRVKKEFNCYDSTYTGLDTLINIQGYFTSRSINDYTGLIKYENGKAIKLGIDTSYSRTVFYPDGMSITGIPDSVNNDDYINLLIREDARFPATICSQGTYKIYGDTIKAQYILNGGNIYPAFEIWFKKFKPWIQSE